MYMGTHITIGEFIIISVGAIFAYAIVKAFIDTYIKK